MAQWNPQIKVKNNWKKTPWWSLLIPADPWATLILNTPNDHNRNGAPCELGTNLSGWVRSTRRYEPFRVSLCWVYVKPTWAMTIQVGLVQNPPPVIQEQQRITIRMEENRDARAGNVWLWPVMARSKWHSKLEGLCCFWQLPNYKTLHKPHPNGKCFNTALSSLLEYDKRLWRPKQKHSFRSKKRQPHSRGLASNFFVAATGSNHSFLCWYPILDIKTASLDLRVPDAGSFLGQGACQGLLHWMASKNIILASGYVYHCISPQNVPINLICIYIYI